MLDVATWIKYSTTVFDPAAKAPDRLREPINTGRSDSPTIVELAFNSWNFHNASILLSAQNTGLACY